MRAAFAHVPVAAHHRHFARHHHVRRPLDAVGQGLPAAVKVVEFRFGHGVVDVDRRHQKFSRSARLSLGTGTNKRPDFQELLSEHDLSLWIRAGSGEPSPVPLVQRVRQALLDPASVSRYGGLSLGESAFLVDELRLWRADDPPEGQMLLPDGKGDLALPVWPDHVGSKGTRWGQFRFSERMTIPDAADAAAWTAVCPLAGHHER